MSILDKFSLNGRRVQFFTESGTWVKPTGIGAVDVIVVAGGGGGGGYGTTTVSLGTDGGDSYFGDIRAISGKAATGQTGSQTSVYGSGGGSTSFFASAGGNGITSGNACVGYNIASTARGVGGASYGAATGASTTEGVTINATPNSGSGGPGVRYSSGGGAYTNGGGGGQVVHKLRVPVTGSVAVTIGAGGIGSVGLTGAKLYAGGNGGSGLVIVFWDE